MPEEKVSTTSGREKWWSSTLLSVDRYLGNYLYFKFEIIRFQDEDRCVTFTNLGVKLPSNHYSERYY